MIAIIDADELCYKVGFGAQHSYYNVYSGGIHVARFTDAKSAKQWINGEEGFTTEKEVVTFSERIALRNFNVALKRILEKVGTKQYVMCVSSPINFRNEIATIQEYKGNRTPDSKPVHYNLLKEYILAQPQTNVVDGYEADDLLAIFYNKLDPQKEKKAVIVTQDKDLLQVPGWFLSLGTEKHSEYAEEGELFFIDEDTGLYNFYSQLISGDATDNIPGVYKITGTRDSKKFHKDLKLLNPIEKDLYVWARSFYEFGLNAKDYTDLDCILWEIGNLLYMRRSFEDNGWEIPL